jgi:hypothetical protein
MNQRKKREAETLEKGERDREIRDKRKMMIKK